MGRRAAKERIELIDLRDATGFGTAFAPSPPPVQRPRPKRRWTRILAPLAIVAIVAGVAIAVTLTDDDRSAPRPATTSIPAPSTTRPTPSPTTAPAPGPGRAARLVGTLPAGLPPPMAWEDSSGGSTSPGMPTTSALWADGIDASPGTRYVEVVAATERSYGSGYGTIRVSTPLGPAVATIDPRRTIVSGPTADGWATVRTAGLTLGEATHVLETVRIDGDRIAIGGVALPAGVHLVGMTNGVAPRWQPATQTWSWSSPAGASTAERSLSVDVGPQMTAYQQTSEWFFLPGSRRVDIGGAPAFLGTSPLTGGQQLTFDRDGLHVVVGATGIADADIVAFASSLHLAPDATWQTMLQARPPAGSSAQDYTLTECAGGTLPGPVDWSAKCGVDRAAPAVLELELDVTSPNGPTFATMTRLDLSTPSIAASATDRLSYVTAAIPTASAGAVLRVVVDGAVAGAVPFSAVPSSAVDHAQALFAVFAFTEPEPYTAQIVAADGTILTAYDPLSPSAA